jgi:hypothetical protein
VCAIRQCWSVQSSIGATAKASNCMAIMATRVWASRPYLRPGVSFARTTPRPIPQIWGMFSANGLAAVQIGHGTNFVRGRLPTFRRCRFAQPTGSMG